MSVLPAAASAAEAGFKAAIEARGVERRFARFAALRGIDLAVRDGETVALFGPNGAGKTTLLRILSLVLRPSGGSLRIFGLDPAREPARTRAALGFVSHETALYLDLTPAENLLFTARLHGLDQRDRRVREALEAVALVGRDVPVRTLSRGLQQRAALARALIHGPRLLLLDEPWTGLDPGAQKLLRERLQAHRQAGGTAIYTTHDLRQGYDSADRVVLLARGRVVFDARRADLPFAELEEAYGRAVEGAA